LIRGLIQYADTDTVIGYGNRIGQMIMSEPALTVHPDCNMFACHVREHVISADAAFDSDGAHAL
jgi:hypothetical protein